MLSHVRSQQEPAVCDESLQMGVGHCLEKAQGTLQPSPQGLAVFSSRRCNGARGVLGAGRGVGQ